MSQTGTQTLTRPQATTEKPRPQPWNVVLLNDDEHTHDYVVRMMLELFAHPKEKGIGIAKRVDADGRAVCLTAHKEYAEFKRDQILAYGRDRQIASCKGSMSAILEPAEFGDDEGEGSGANDRRD